MSYILSSVQHQHHHCASSTVTDSSLHLSIMRASSRWKALSHDFQMQFCRPRQRHHRVRDHSMAAAAAATAAAATPPTPPHPTPPPAAPPPASATERCERMNLLLLETGVFWLTQARSFQVGQPGAARNRTGEKVCTQMFQYVLVCTSLCWHVPCQKCNILSYDVIYRHIPSQTCKFLYWYIPVYTETGN
jgi:hypothetical protein